MTDHVATRTRGIPEQRSRATVRFTNAYGTYAGLDEDRRRWLITPSVSGWQLEFLGPGERTPTGAGTYQTLRDAQRAAGRRDVIEAGGPKPATLESQNG